MDFEQQSFVRSSKLLKSFWHVQRNLARYVQKTAMANDLSVPQFFLLKTIAPLGAVTQKQLGETIQLPKSTLSQAVDGLVQAELVMRQPVKDNRREMQLTISEKGKTLFETIRLQKGSIQQTMEKAIDTLTEEQYEELLAIHLKIATFLEKEATEQGECSK
ncbi:MarR family transcriptional regulator [Bacillus sp. FJAT-29790]|uniref:MarR family winged helix-turn-helix transcriptional regulator n=1 Tax=Bacillus sp. FJAT-29790 TaxID=1895002 RepID=UPI001C224774|nr:MarR family transcriptional regulator [Bacillus sp. FJAT-29790]MBU8880428.1 MarR family transcriptional regulator [Bacillus sp. FJAT-29790]